jgi:hypothetical protein
MAFPVSPTNGQTAVVNNITYQFSNVGNTWTRLGSTANTITANIITANTLNINTLISVTGNVTGNYILGNGSLLTGITTNPSNISNGTSNVRVVSSGGNVTVSVGGTGNVAVFATTGEYITGLLSASGNITGGNLLTAGAISATGTLSVTGNTTLSTTSTGNLSAGNVTTGGIVSATANITGGNILTAGVISATGTITSNGATNGTAFAVGNSAVSNVALGMFPTAGQAGEYAIRDYSNIFSHIYFDVGIGGSANGAFQFRSSNAFRSFANINSTGLTTPLAISATGNITGNYFIGNGSLLTGISGGGGGTPGGSNTNVQFNDGGAFGGNAQFTYDKVTNTLTAGIVSANTNGTGQNFKVGDDIWIGDINQADTMSFRGQQNAANAYIVFGNADGTKLGRTGTGPLTYGGAFSATGNVTGGNIISLGIVSTVGRPTFGAITLPNTDGTANQLLATYGNGSLYFANVSAGNVLSQTFTGNGVQTIFTLSSAPPSINSTFVSYNGVLLLRSTYSLSGANITFSSAPANASSIEVTTVNPGSGGLSGTPTAAGTDTQIQFNDGGIFGASANLTFNKTSSVFTAKNLASGGSINETVYTITDGAGVDLDPVNGTVQLWTLGASRTPTANNFSSGQSMTLMVTANVYSITWSSVAVTWVGNSAPTLSSTGNTVIVLWKVSSTVYGALTGTV